MKRVVVAAVVLLTAGTARAEPSDGALVGAGLGMAVPDYFLGVTLHEGTHALVAELMGADVTSLHLYPGINPQTHHFQFGWTGVRNLPRGRGHLALFLLSPKITDALFIAGYDALFLSQHLPANQWAWLTVQVLATGFWVDFAKDVLVFHRFDDVVRVFDAYGFHSEWQRLPLRLLYAAIDVGAGYFIALGWRDLFRS